MSKPVRLPDYLAEEIGRLAAQEKRSLANMVRVLLEQALSSEQRVAVPGSVLSAAPDSHFKPDPK